MTSRRSGAGRFVTNPDLLVCWRGRWLLIKNLATKTALQASPVIVALLHNFARPRDRKAALPAMRGYAPETVDAVIDELLKHGFLVADDPSSRRPSLVKAFRENLASLHYYASSRDIPYLEDEQEAGVFLQRDIVTTRRPPRFKRSRGAPRVALPRAEHQSEDAAALSRTLLARRTVRSFSDTPVALGALSSVIRGTFGATGVLHAGSLGKLTTKTSPSAGGLHPIECYVIAWNVRGLSKGIYHYDVPTDSLARLRSGDFREQAVTAAAGQAWVRDAAFVCVLTAVFGRTFWKYRTDNGYRVILLDAGHLCQTFCLLATAHGIGPFQTAALKESLLEELLALDGAKEFAVYLCGGGMPAASTRDGEGLTWTPRAARARTKSKSLR